VQFKLPAFPAGLFCAHVDEVAEISGKVAPSFKKQRMVQQTDGDPLSKSQGKQDDVAYPKVKASRMM